MSRADLVVAVDCSTTAAKAVVQDGDGLVLAQASSPLTTSRPQASWHEQDAEDWWGATRSAVRQAVAALPAPERVGALCLTHQRESFVCLGADDRPLRPAVLWLDGRARAEIADLGSQHVHEVSGKPPDTTPALYKLAWLSRHETRVLQDAARVGDVHAYLALRLTGRWATSVASADTLGLFDLRRSTWSPELLRLAGLRAEQLPQLVPVGALVAGLTAAAADELGLPADLPLVAGTGDGQAAGVGLGATAPGVAYLNLGTSMVLGVQSQEYLANAAFRTLAGVREGTWTLETVLNAAAYVATWCREEMGEQGTDGQAGAGLEAAAARLPVGAEGLLTLPYWNAAQSPWWDPSARGVTIGWQGRHTRAHLYRSILEGVGHELALHLERLETATGEPVTAIRVVGGGSRSALWVQVLADVTGRTIRVCGEGEWSAAGAAAIARSFLAGDDGPAQQPVPPGRDVSPDPAATALHAGFSAVHRRLYPALRELFPDLLAAAEAVQRTGDDREAG